MEEVKDVSTIQDEDVLRRMWQTTEDFSRKKEIRAHMYKLREARLKEFYTTGEVFRDVQRSNSSPGLREQPCVKDEGPTHADSLADHSFLSLKTKEIRDSESPTREVQYKNSKNRDTDGQWTISSKTETSDDGKRITSSQVATTQGVRAVDGGELTYAAANEHEASLYSDGDANNYTRSMGESSKTFAQENVVSGDKNNFRSSKTTSSSSSSRLVTHHSSTTGDFENLAIMDTDYIPEDYAKTSTKVTKNIYTSGEIPDDLKKSIADGNTKVYTETKTLPDGSTFTTTRYETIGTKQLTSGSTTKCSKQVVESSEINNKHIDNNSRVITTKSREIFDDTPVETETVRITKSEKRIRDNDDNSRIVTTETREIYDDSPKTETIKIIKTEQVYDDDYITNLQNERIIRNDDRKVVTDTKVTITKEDYVPEPTEIYTTVTTKSFSNVTENEPKYDQPDNISNKSLPKERPQNLEVVKSCKPDESYKPNSPTDGQYSTTYRSEFTNKKISVEVSATHDAFARSLRSISPDRLSERPKSLGSIRTSTSSIRSSTSPDKCPRSSPERKPNYDRSPDQKRPATSPTKHEYYPQRPSPERKRPDSITVTKTTETITKKKLSDRMSPERPNQSYSPARTPTSPTKIDVTISKTTKVNRNQTSPERPRGSSPIKHIERTSPVKDVNTDTITKRKKIPVDNERKSPERSPTKTTNEIISTETITKKKKVPVHDNKRTSPIRSPTKTSTDIITVNTDTITRKKNVPDDDKKSPIRSPTKHTTITTEVTEINTDTLTRKKKKSLKEPKNNTLTKNTEVTNIESQIVTDTKTTKRPTSRDLSPTSLASDIEYINHNRHIVTDLDEPCDEDIKVTKDKKSRTKSPTKDKSSPVKEVPKKYKPTPDLDSPSEKPPTVFNVLDDSEQVCKVLPQDTKEKPPLKRTETYEERCRQMLGLPEPDNIPKKEYDDMYAGKEPVEEPMFTKKYVAPLGPEDNLMHKTVEKIKQRRPETDEIDIDEFIVTERKDVLKTSKPNNKPKRIPSPQKPKDDGEYTTEYTDEYIKKPVPEKCTPDKPTTKSVESKPDTKDKKPVKTTSPDRKSPQRKVPKDIKPTEGEYTTEYVDEYCDKPVTKKPDTTDKKPSSPERKSPQKKSPTDTEYNTEYTTKITTTTDRKSTTSPDRKLSRDIPEKKPSSPERKSPQKKTPTDTEYTTDYTTEITTTTDRKCTTPDKKISREIPEKKPSSPERKSPQKKSPTDTEYTTDYTTEITTTTDKKSTSSPDRKISREIPETKPSSPERKSLQKKSPTDTEYTTEYTTNVTTTIEKKSTSPDRKPIKESPETKPSSPERKSPQKKSPTNTEHTTNYTTEITTTTDIKCTTPDKKISREIPEKKPSSPERKSPQKKSPTDTEYTTDYTTEITTTTDIKSSTPDKKISREIPEKKPSSPERKSPQKKSPTDTEYTTDYATNITTTTDRKSTSSPDRKLSREIPEKKPSSPERKSPQKKSPTDTEYTTEYTTNVTTTIEKKSTSPDRKPIKESPEKKEASPERKTPQKKSPTDTEYTTEYITKITNLTDEKAASPNRKPIQESPEKKSSPERKSPQKKSPTDTEYTSEYTSKVTTTTDRKSTSPDRKPSQPKHEPENMKFSTEYTDEYCEVTDKYVTTRKPAGKKTELTTNDITPVPVVSSPTKKQPKKGKKPKRPDDSTDEEDIDEYITTETIKKDKYIPENVPKTNDFISREKYDTDITLTTQKSPLKHDKEFNLETENTQTTHIRTHRIDTTVQDVTVRETSPRRHPQKAVPSDTMECAFKKTITEDENIIKKKPEEPKSLKKPTKLDDRKSPVKQVIKKDSVPKSITSVKTVTKKLFTTEIEPKKVQEIPKKKSSSERIPKERSPERINARSPSPVNKSVKKTVKKISTSTTRTPSESPVRKSNTNLPTSTTSPDRKPQKTTTKASPISKITEPTNKHIVTKTISLANRPDIKPQPDCPVKNIPKSIPTVKNTKLTQPSSVTVTTLKTTKITKKTIKPQKPDTDTETDSETEIINVSDSRGDKKKVVTTAKIKINNVSKEPNVTMPSIKVNTNDVITDNQQTKSDELTTKCITTKSIVLNHAETEEVEFIIDLQRSTSSREPSPDKICPIPVSSEDEGSYPRYPDQVSEPDDQPAHRRPVKVLDIPLNEEEDVKDFNRITEITETTEVSSRKPITRITDIDMVTETDESLLSVTEKVNKFITTAEKLTDDEPKTKTPAPKVPRPELHIDEHLENDECLLSVSDKVSKFITTAEHVAVKTTDRPKSPRPRENTPVEYKVNENDECLLSVNQKVSHFIQAAETSKQKPATREGPAPKVSRPKLIVDETLQRDECLLSVSDKVNKFHTTAEKLTDVKTIKTETIKRESPEKQRVSPEKQRESPEKFSKPDMTYKREPSPEKQRESPEKVTFKREPSPEKSPIKSLETCELPYRPKSEPKPIEKPETKPVNLKSSEAVRKAKAMFENISKTQEALRQRDILSRPSIWEGRKKPEKPEDDVKLTDIGVYRKPEPENIKKLSYTSDDTCKKITTDLKDVSLKSTKLILNESNVEKTRYLSPEKDIPGYMKPISKPSRDELPETKIYRSKSPNPNGEIPGYIKPILKQTPDEPDRPISRSRSPNPNGEIPGYMKPILKVSAEERDKHILETRLRETYSPEKILHYENGNEIPHYMLPLQRHQSPERDTHCSTKITKETEIIETVKEKSQSPERDIPGYMKPLQRHAHSPDREERKNVDDDDSPRAAKKFGVTLRRTDSGRMITTTLTERRRSSTPGQPNIEEIQDLEVLERMMDKVVGYEQRRRIRAQIRIVKKGINENKIQMKTTKITPSPKDSTVTKISPQHNRKSPVRDTKRAKSPIKKSSEPRQKSPDPKRRPSIDKSTFSTVTNTTTHKSERITSTKERSLSPEPKKRSQSSQIYKTDLKHVQPTNKIVQDDKPSWVTNRNLKKTSETVTEKKITSSVKKPEPKRSPSPQKDEKPMDCITSSYGIGPTDENGQPLFGIRALRKAADNKVHIRGTVMTSQFYSENGEEPVGEVTLTKYSNDPKELNIDDEQINKSKGIASITTTQKFGSRGSPTLSSLVDKKKAITDQTEDELFKTTSTKVTRRGSVKALSQKFIENAVETSRNEKQTYPKAGLILRTSSFKETNQNTDRNSSRESSPGYQPRGGKISLDSITSDSRQQTIQDTSSTKTFLNSHTRVANAQEVITRMKNSETEHIEGDTPEDREARMLLNKFLGAQVLMSGMEPLMTAQTMSTTSTSSSQLVRKVQKKTVTSTTKETSKPLSLTKRYQTPITAEVLQDIWDEQTLRALLEQCTDYEERRAIRARLRQVMAEQEAVANVVANAVAEGDRTMQERIETTKKTFSEGPVTTTQVSTTRVVQQSKQVSKPISPFAKFRQLDKQNSLNTPPSSPRTPTGTGAPLFKFTDPALSHSASTVKDRLLHWCQMKTKEYQNIKLENFSTSWADGMAFCALIHHFLPDTFDYHALNPKQRRHNFTLAFKVADEQAGIAPLLDVDDMVAMRRPDWKCVFTYVQSIYRRFKDED